jgi:predicted transcriptional regulator
MKSAELIHKIRNQLGMSQRKFGVFTGISYTAISFLERGIFIPRQDTVRKIIHACAIKGIVLGFEDFYD